MKLPMKMMVTVVVMALSVLASGCSWIMWNHVPERSAPPERIECSKGGPIADTLGAGVFAIGTGVAVGVLAHPDCSGSHNELCGLSALGALYVGIPLGVIALIYSAAAISGWVNYNNCRTYQERVSLDDKFGISQKLFRP